MAVEGAKGLGLELMKLLCIFCGILRFTLATTTLATSKALNDALGIGHGYTIETGGDCAGWDANAPDVGASSCNKGDAFHSSLSFVKVIGVRRSKTRIILYT